MPKADRFFAAADLMRDHAWIGYAVVGGFMAAMLVVVSILMEV